MTTAEAKDAIGTSAPHRRGHICHGNISGWFIKSNFLHPIAQICAPAAGRNHVCASEKLMLCLKWVLSGDVHGAHRGHAGEQPSSIINKTA